MTQKLALLVIFGLIAACVSCSSAENRADKSQTTVDAAIKVIVPSRARVVWCQDIGEGADTFASGHEFRLMGYDSSDGLGERVILSKPSNYSRPLITPNGDRVVFSKRGEEKIYIVNWDGSGLKVLNEGLAVSVWRNPEDGTEWVYAGTRIEKSATITDVRRFPVDRPEVEEFVWNKTPVEADNFQVSADGRMASGAFPWPDCGMAMLPNISWQRYARGCWPSIAPDESGMFWVFDGSHRNLTIFAADTEERWVVNINNAPGVDNHEVYHPRWSNHPRFMTMTGPYTVGASANRIRAGGKGVEIYIGMFDSDFRSIEHWVQVTDNEYADFYPDLWIETEPRIVSPSVRNFVESKKRREPLWPGDTQGLVFLWENRNALNEIKDKENKLFRVCNVEPSGLAVYGRFFEMELRDGAFSAEPGTLLAECRESNSIGIEALITPRLDVLPGFTPIISFGCITEDFNFALGQRDEKLILLFQTSDRPEDKNGYELCKLIVGSPNHVVVGYESGIISCFLNGNLVFVSNDISGDLSNWKENKLFFGHAGELSWRGALEGIAIYARSIKDEEARRKFDLYSLRMAERSKPARAVVEARMREASGIPEPETIAPYRRALAINPYEILNVIEGEFPHKEVLIAHWIILDAHTLDSAKREAGSTHRMVLEPFEDRPELEGERLIMDSDDFALPMYYELDG